MGQMPHVSAIPALVSIRHFNHDRDLPEPSSRMFDDDQTQEDLAAFVQDLPIPRLDVCFEKEHFPFDKERFALQRCAVQVRTWVRGQSWAEDAKDGLEGTDKQ